MKEIMKGKEEGQRKRMQMKETMKSRVGEHEK